MSIDLGAMWNRANAEAGLLPLADITSLFDTMYQGAYARPDMLLVSPRMKKRLVHWKRVGKLNRAHPLPRHKIRKCHMRHVYALRHKGMARIARIERREAQEEAEIMRHI